MVVVPLEVEVDKQRPQSLAQVRRQVEQHGFRTRSVVDVKELKRRMQERRKNRDQSRSDGLFVSKISIKEFLCS